MNTKPNTPASRNEAATLSDEQIKDVISEAIGFEWEQNQVLALDAAEVIDIVKAALALAAPGAAIDAGGQGTVSVDLYLKLADAMGYDSGKDGMEFSPEEWAAALLKDALTHRAASRPEAPPASASPATVAQPVAAGDALRIEVGATVEEWREFKEWLRAKGERAV